MPLSDGTHELTGPYELIEVANGVPVRYLSLDHREPTAAEEATILANIETKTGLRVRLVDWVVEEGDPRDSGRHARVVVLRTFAYFLDGDARPAREAIEAHVAYLRMLDDRGALVVCGPFTDGGGIVCIEAASVDEARAIADADPFVTTGIRTARVRELQRATRANGYLL
jgi:uncharacterized protein YciI